MSNLVIDNCQISKTIDDYRWKNHGPDFGRFYKCKILIGFKNRRDDIYKCRNVLAQNQITMSVAIRYNNIKIVSLFIYIQ